MVGLEIMQLPVFAKLAKTGAISEVIIYSDPLDLKNRTVVDIVTVFGHTLRLSTLHKTPRYFIDIVNALEILASQTGELRNVKVKIRSQEF